MLRIYLKTAWRNIWKSKLFSLINIFGLTVGLAFGMLILFWVQDELSIDSYHLKAGQIYKLELFGGTGTSRQIWDVDVAPMGPLAKQQLPEVIDQVRISSVNSFSLYTYKEKVFGSQNVFFTDPSFFSIFDFPLIKGNTRLPFPDDHSLVITQKTAKKYFGDEDPIGKTIMADKRENFTVNGVIADIPANSTMQADMFMPMSYHVYEERNAGRDIMNDFSNFNYTTYLLLKPEAGTQDLSKKLFDIHIHHKSEDTDVQYLLQPLTKTHLYRSDGTDKGMQTVRIFFVIAILLLIIACINYINLSTARSLLRAKEVSMKKVIGAGKGQLFLQFILETTLLFILAATLAIILMVLLLQVFNEIAGKQLVLDLRNARFWLILLATLSGTLLASSIYPAILLSSFDPLKALKGKISNGIGNVLFRKILVVVQFVFSVALIAGTVAITRQLNYIHSKELGYDKSHTLFFGMRDMAPHYEAVKEELLKQPGITDVTRSMGNILNLGNLSGSTDWDGKAPNSTFIIHPVAIDANFLSFYHITLARGKTFTGMPADSNHYILNETAIKEAGIKDPVGKRFKMWDKEGTIIGVVKDFHFASLKQKIGPALFYYAPEKAPMMQIRTTVRQAAKAIRAAGAQFKKYNGQYPFGYAFQDEIFNYLYQDSQREAILFNYFSGIAIFISCLGLLGLATYTAQVRTKEIGVRKVLGASIAGILQLLSVDFLKLVVIAIVIAVPLAWFAMSKWLESFAYRTHLDLSIFLIAGLFAIGIALLTISFQSVRAAMTNPVKSLRDE